jgi:hypothetical protein
VTSAQPQYAKPASHLLTVQRKPVQARQNEPMHEVGEFLRLQYLLDLDAVDPADACFFTAMGEVIAGRLNGR